MIAASATHRRRARGFTLLEVLVTMAIIITLLSLLTGVGIAVLNNQQSRVMENVLKGLNGALDAYAAETSTTGAFKPPIYRPIDYAGMPGVSYALPEPLTPGGPPTPNTDNVTTPVTAGGAEANPNDIQFITYAGRAHPIRPDASVFLRQAAGFGEVDAIIQGLPDRFVTTTISPPGSANAHATDNDPTPSILDTWADPEWAHNDRQYPLAAQQLVYYIHPDNRLARALYGQTQAGRPYFLSAGPDRLYGLPEEFAIDASGDTISARTGESFRKMSGEATLDFKQRVLREARADNLSSYAIDLSFTVDVALLNQLWAP